MGEKIFQKNKTINLKIENLRQTLGHIYIKNLSTIE